MLQKYVTYSKSHDVSDTRYLQRYENFHDLDGSIRCCVLLHELIIQTTYTLIYPMKNLHSYYSFKTLKLLLYYG
jgi:hypothetical protein